MIPLFRLLREIEVQMEPEITAVSRNQEDHKIREVCGYQMELDFEELQSSKTN
jgi:hypothetical protein